MAAIKSMKIGGMVTVKQDALPALPFSRSPNADPRTRNGILGLDVLKQMRAVVDFKNHRLLIRRSRSKKSLPEILDSLEHSKRLSFKLSKSGPHHILAAKVDDIPVRLVVDSGADRFVLDEAYCRRNKIGLRAATDGNRAVGAGGHALSVSYADLKSLDIGGKITLRNFITPVIDLSHVKGDSEDAFDGAIGIRMLTQIGFLYDTVAGQLLLRFPEKRARDGGQRDQGG